MAAQESIDGALTNDDMEIRVKTVGDENFEFKVPPNLLVSELKEKITVIHFSQNCLPAFEF